MNTLNLIHEDIENIFGKSISQDVKDRLAYIVLCKCKSIQEYADKVLSKPILLEEETEPVGFGVVKLENVPISFALDIII